MKKKTEYVCTECGTKSPKWHGRCPSCDAWGTFQEIKVERSGRSRPVSVSDSKATRIADISSDGAKRIVTGNNELDRVLGGGIIPGSLILVGGDPGIGKSTLLLQMCGNIANIDPIYVTGEESLQQIKHRASRMPGLPEDILILAETNVESIASEIENTNCGLVVIDSIQSIYSDRIDGTPGSIIQVRECASLLMNIAKKTGKPVFLIGHVTKEGVIAGPKLLEHMVDTVLQFEGEKTYSYRILRSIKNRFGSTNEIGIFEMGDKGLREVPNPSEVFLAQREENASGIAIVASIEGTRPILLEVQALVSPSGYSVPQRTSTGFEMRRLQMILAVLEKRLGVEFRHNDVFVNVAGGVYMNDPSLDLGLAAALVSSLNDNPVEQSSVLIGEIGLTGEVRPVANAEQRIKEAEKLGFKRIFIPSQSFDKINGKYSIEIVPVPRISIALSKLMG